MKYYVDLVNLNTEPLYFTAENIAVWSYLLYAQCDNFRKG